MDAEDARFRRFLEPGSEIAGSVSGASVGLLIGGPAGAVVGAVVPTVVSRGLRYALAEATGWHLGRRQQARVAGAALVAADRVRARLGAGDQPRQDGFLGDLQGGRPDADEVAEGVLLAAGRAHEERKVPYLGRLLANVAFEGAVSGADANALVRQVDRLSYRQLCLLALFGATERHDPRAAAPSRYQVMWQALRRSDRTRSGTLAVLGEIEDLGRQGLVEIGQGVSTSIASSVWLLATGNLLYDLLELPRVPADELDALDALLLARPSSET